MKWKYAKQSITYVYSLQRKIYNINHDIGSTECCNEEPNVVIIIQLKRERSITFQNSCQFNDNISEESTTIILRQKCDNDGSVTYKDDQ
jgi:hypothetical protein